MFRRGALVILALVAAACSGSSSSPSTTRSTSGSTPATPATSAAPDTQPTIAVTTTTSPPTVPAGVQFTSPAVPLPGQPYGLGFDGATWLMGGQVKNGHPPCNVLSVCGDNGLNAVVYMGSPSAGFTTTQVDDATTYAPPAGLSAVHRLTPSAIAHSAKGWVIAGNAYLTDPLAHNIGSRGLIWFSTDAKSWTRIDVRNVVGDVTTVLNDVVATPDGFTIVGAQGSADLKGPSQALVLHSTDGSKWTASTLPLTWSGELYQVKVFGSTLVVRGDEFMCTSSSYGLIDFNVGGQDRMWRSTDAGATFTQVDLAPTGEYTVKTPAPTDPAACKGLDLNALSQFAASAGTMNAAGNRLFLFAVDGTSVASTTDATTWTNSKLDGAISGGVSLATVDGDGFAVSRVQRPARNGVALTFGLQGLGWRADSTATTFTSAPTPPPLLGADPGQLVADGAGSIFLINSTSTGPGLSTSSVLQSTSGPVAAAAECSFTAGAKCGLATVSGQDLSGKDLSGIDFTGADFSNVTLDGANLTGAILRDTIFAGGTAKGTNFTGADFANALLTSTDLTGANLTNANLKGARVPISLFSGVTLTGAVLGVDVDFTTPAPAASLSFAGLNLSGSSFSNFDAALIDLQHTNWTGAVLNGAHFFGLDLSGANFTGADMRNMVIGQKTTMAGAVVPGANIGHVDRGLIAESPNWTADTACPDGKPPSNPGRAMFNPCRFA